MVDIGNGKTVRLYTVDRKDNRQIGKIVPYGPRLIYASTFSPEHTRQKDGNRLGVNLAVIEFCRQHGVGHFIVVDSKGMLPVSMGQPRAYMCDMGALRQHGIVNSGGRWGSIVNLPDKFWREITIPKLPFIRDPGAFVSVYATSDKWEAVA